MAAEASKESKLSEYPKAWCFEETQLDATKRGQEERYIKYKKAPREISFIRFLNCNLEPSKNKDFNTWLSTKPKIL